MAPKMLSASTAYRYLPSTYLSKYWYQRTYGDNQGECSLPNIKAPPNIWPSFENTRQLTQKEERIRRLPLDVVSKVDFKEHLYHIKIPLRFYGQTTTSHLHLSRVAEGYQGGGCETMSSLFFFLNPSFWLFAWHHHPPPPPLALWWLAYGRSIT